MHRTGRGGPSASPRKWLLAIASSALLLSVVLPAQQDERDREKVDRVADILTALGAREGAHVADLGSADGFYTLRIAKAVGSSGRAYAIDIDEKALDKLRERAQKDALNNIQIIRGEAADPKLPVGALDVVLIRNAYHEMPEYRSVLTGVMSGLKAGGLLIIVEAIHDNNRPLSREQQVKEHEIAPELVEAELREAGF